jgi:hypothetical protein
MDPEGEARVPPNPNHHDNSRNMNTNTLRPATHFQGTGKDSFGRRDTGVDELCINCGAPFNDHDNTRCPCDVCGTAHESDQCPESVATIEQMTGRQPPENLTPLERVKIAEALTDARDESRRLRVQIEQRKTVAAVEEFYVYDSVRDQWLQEDERSFGPFDGRAIFANHGDPKAFGSMLADARAIARGVAKREARGRTGLIILSQRVKV